LFTCAEKVCLCRFFLSSSTVWKNNCFCCRKGKGDKRRKECSLNIYTPKTSTHVTCLEEAVGVVAGYGERKYPSATRNHTSTTYSALLTPIPVQSTTCGCETSLFGTHTVGQSLCEQRSPEREGPLYSLAFFPECIMEVSCPL